MKKIYLLLLAIIASHSMTYAQGLDKPWWSIRAGVNFSNLSAPDYSTQFLTGYSLGAAYAYPISETIPIYIESGLYFQKRGARDNGFLTDAGDESKLTKHEFQIPILLGYSLPLTGLWEVHPFVGFYYSVAVDGNFEIGDTSFDPYRKEMLQTLRDTQASEQQLLHRSDLGLRLGLSVVYGRYLLGFAYDGGLLNLYTPKLREVGYQALSGCFTLQAGYNF
ncbi:MAG: outer membrane beta-barrel protein [Rikenellaceae bacterium]